MDIVLFGSGNVATHLKNTLISKKGISIVQWYSPSFKPGMSQELIPKTASLSHLKKAALYILAVTDDALPELSSKLPSEAFVVHTSGSQPMDTLENQKKRGVFYPLQSISKNQSLDFSKIPICIEGNSDDGIEKLKYLANQLEAKVYRVNSKERLALHLAAVFANNFTNHLYTIAETICLENNVAFELLKPLIQETAHKIKDVSPKQVQTGPAIRNDQKSIEKHLDFIASEEQRKLYTLLSQSIQQKHKNE